MMIVIGFFVKERGDHYRFLGISGTASDDNGLLCFNGFTCFSAGTWAA